MTTGICSCILDCIFFINTRHVGASCISLAPTFFTKKSECAQSAAPPFQSANAVLVCGLRGRGFRGGCIFFINTKHIGASLVSLAPIFFQKVRACSRRCFSFPNRTRSIGLRLGGASAGRNALILLDCRETTVSPTDCEQTVRSVLLLCKGNRRAGEQRARCPVFRA